MANKITKFKENLIRGDTPLVQFPLTINGSAADLTGYNATFTITESESPVSGDVPVIQITDTGDNTGTLEFQLLNGQVNNDTSVLDPSKTYYWDLQLSNDGSGTALRIVTPLRGTLGVDADYNLGTS
jgi:hypothetical protein